MRRGAADSAVAYLQRALEEPPPPERRTAVLIALGAAEALTSGPAAAEHLKAAYDVLDDPVARGRVADGLGRALLFTARPHEAAALAARPRPRCRPARRTCARRSRRSSWPRTTSASAAPRCASGSRATAAPRPGAGAKGLASMAAIDWTHRGGTADECAALALAVLADGELVETDNGLMSIPAIPTLALADRDEALTVLEESLDVAHRHGSLFSAPSVRLFLGMTLLWRGDLAGAAANLRRGQGGLPGWGFGAISQIYCDTHLALVACARGDVAGARRILDVQPFADDTATPRATGSTPAGRPGRRGAVGGRARDGRRLGRALRRLREPGPGAGARQGAGARAARPADEGVALVESELADARAVGAPSGIGAALRVLGTLRGADGGPGWRRRPPCSPSAARLEHARALAALGTALRRRRRPTEAREPLRAALELAAACDAPGLAEHVRTELYATGARPRTDALAGVAALTASERRVAERAAAGDTNRDIAQALFVTPKTVEVHLSNAYRKLGIRSRRELPVARTP